MQLSYSDQKKKKRKKGVFKRRNRLLAGTKMLQSLVILHWVLLNLLPESSRTNVPSWPVLQCSQTRLFVMCTFMLLTCSTACCWWDVWCDWVRVRLISLYSPSSSTSSLSATCVICKFHSVVGCVSGDAVVCSLWPLLTVVDQWGSQGFTGLWDI